MVESEVFHWPILQSHQHGLGEGLGCGCGCGRLGPDGVPSSLIIMHGDDVPSSLMIISPSVALLLLIKPV